MINPDLVNAYARQLELERKVSELTEEVSKLRSALKEIEKIAEQVWRNYPRMMMEIKQHVQDAKAVPGGTA